MGRVEERVVSLVGRSFEDGGLARQVGRKRQESSPIREGVLVELDRRRQGLEGKCDVLMVPGRVGCRPWHLLSVSALSKNCKVRRDKQQRTWPMLIHRSDSLMLVADLS